MGAPIDISGFWSKPRKYDTDQSTAPPVCSSLSANSPPAGTVSPKTMPGMGGSGCLLGRKYGSQIPVTAQAGKVIGGFRRHRAETLVVYVGDVQGVVARREIVGGIELVGPAPHDDLLADAEIGIARAETQVALAQHAAGLARVRCIRVARPAFHHQGGVAEVRGGLEPGLADADAFVSGGVPGDVPGGAAQGAGQVGGGQEGRLPGIGRAGIGRAGTSLGRVTAGRILLGQCTAAGRRRNTPPATARARYSFSM